MGTVNYDIDYNDSRFQKVETDKKAALSELEKTYGGMVNNADKYYQSQIDASKEWAETQKKNQQAQTDFAIEKIEQNKAQAKKDYTKEQSGAYVDWQKQSNPYGATAEQQATLGMYGTGYSESSQVSLYNTYQNRVTTAREAYALAVQNYNNSITEARLQNNSVLAEIAYNALQQQLELSLQGFQYKNQLLLAQADKKTELENTYYNRYLSVIDQINKENALAEEVRQYDESLAFQKDQAYKAAKSSSSSSSSTIKKKDNSAKNGAKKAASSISKSSSKSSVKSSKSSSTAVKTYSEAAKVLQKAGATTGDGGLMTKSEWSRRKRSGSNRAETSYATYEDYLNSFTAWRMANPE
jgi:hypothetical protein